ncbi:MAG TPA: uracil-DNA glycosylase [Gemmatimonadaceae bacterium]|nr:uracil-DNA glycosylase [Gemmatimonadaceae bacterium]
MDARAQLRKYLEQRKQAGESDLVLDRLSVEEALRLVGAGGALVGPETDLVRPPASESAIAAPSRDEGSSDWRAVLRTAGASPTEKPVSIAGTRESAPVAQTQAHPKPSGADLDVPPGISIGDSDRQLFGGPMGELDSLDAVAKSVAGCTRCPLYSTATNPVPGQGNPNADLMIVGEAPGATEDEQGLAFVGAAGQLLTKILAAVDLKRDDVFICNVLKHRPPGNRDPLPDEVKACSPYLVRQLELIRPKVILALGKFAAQTLLESTLAIGKLRGQLHRYYGVPLIVTYHPAALLRNPSWKRPTWEDVQLVRRILDRAVAQP